MDTHRIDIPHEYGGGWVDIKAKRSWRDSNRIAGAAFHIKRGVTQAEIEAAQAEGRMADLMEMDTHGRLSAPLETAIVATSAGLKPDDMSVRAWLDSDELSEDVGDFLIKEITEFYEANVRTPEERKTSAGHLTAL
jgi:hypothetical protein